MNQNNVPKDVILYAICHFCSQKVRVGWDCQTFSCPYCRQPNINPFNPNNKMKTERNNEMLPKRDEKGRFIKENDFVAKNKIFVNKQIDNLPAAPAPAKKKGFWEVEIDCVTECSKVNTDVEAHFKPIIRPKIQLLMEKFKNIEWLVYLLGEKRFEDDKLIFTINDIHIPIQKVSSGLVWDVECSEYNTLPVIGVMHSHHGMGTGFSPTDHDFVNSNHNLSLVISNKQIAGQARVDTPCGSVKIIDKVTIKHLIDNNFDHEGFEKEIKKINQNVTQGHNHPNNKKKKKKHQKPEMTAAQKSYSNGVSVKELSEPEKVDEDWFDNKGVFAVCPKCSAIVDADDFRCEFCQEDLM